MLISLLTECAEHVPCPNIPLQLVAVVKWERRSGWVGYFKVMTFYLNLVGTHIWCVLLELSSETKINFLFYFEEIAQNQMSTKTIQWKIISTTYGFIPWSDVGVSPFLYFCLELRKRNYHKLFYSIMERAIDDTKQHNKLGIAIGYICKWGYLVGTTFVKLPTQRWQLSQ